MLLAPRDVAEAASEEEQGEAGQVGDEGEAGYVGVQGPYAGTPIPPVFGNGAASLPGAGTSMAQPAGPQGQTWHGAFPAPQTGGAGPGLRAQSAPKRPFDSGGSSGTTVWAPTAIYTWGAAGLVSEYQMQLPCAGGNSGSLFYAYFPDGTTGALTDINGAVQDVYLDSAYGEQWGYIGAGDPNPFQYGGQFGYYTDPLNIVSLVLCGQRWYVPAAGFWLSRDPAGYSGGDNLYRFCDDNPLAGADPSGLQSPGGGMDSTDAWIMAVTTSAGFYAGFFTGGAGGGGLGTLALPGGGTAGGAVVGSFEGGVAGSAAGAAVGTSLVWLRHKLADLSSRGSGGSGGCGGGKSGGGQGAKPRPAQRPSASPPGQSRYYGRTVADILKDKLGNIRKAPLDKGSPSWSDIMNLKWEDIEEGAKACKPGFRTVRKLLTDRRFNK